MESLKGIVDKISFRNDENGYTIMKLEVSQRPKKTVVVTGILGSTQEGETLEVFGKWVNHPKYGYQFNIAEYKTIHPVTVPGIIKYLSSGLIKGIGDVYAERIVEKFGMETLDIIENNIEKLNDVEGIGPKRIELIRQSWEEQRAIKDVMLFLASHNISTTYALKMYRIYGNRAVEVVKQNPYQLIYDISGIGFITADKIARTMGIAEDAPERIQAGIVFILTTAAEDGHVYLEKSELINRGQELLAASPELIDEALVQLAHKNRVFIDDSRLYLPFLYYAETEIAVRISQLLTNPLPVVNREVVNAEIQNIEILHRITFTAKQREAIIQSLNNRILIITGGPGTGKTTTVKGIIEIFFRRNLRVALGAPTGRAAKRLEEATGKEGKTIHRLLEYNPRNQQFAHNETNPLSEDAVIIDESSMIDTPLFGSLIKAIHPGSRLIIVGDADQLPSVGPGNILLDILHSGKINVVQLDQIFRQKNRSDIVTNAHRINSGEFPYISNREDDNFFLVKEELPEKITETIRELCISRLPNKYNLDPIKDIQVISPLYKGVTGAHNLNIVLQEALSTGKNELRRGGTLFREGDKVMQIRNNYDKEIYNGDIGWISQIDKENLKMIVIFDERPVAYDFKELDEIILAYAITVHKSQGSEYPAVVMPITTQHYIMLQRNLIYTAVTRAKMLFVFVGTLKALHIAIKNNTISQRFTYLNERLRSHISVSQSDMRWNVTRIVSPENGTIDSDNVI